MVIKDRLEEKKICEDIIRVLDKPHRLIDADKLRKDVLDLPNCPNGFSDTYDKAMILTLVDEQPIVDAPLKHGCWIDDKGMYKCSVCNNLWAHWWIVACPKDRMYKEMKFCPNCGAKMVEEKENE